MAEKRTQVELPGSGLVDAVEVEVAESTERWTDITLTDGSTIRLKTVVLGVLRIEGQYDPDGNPLYQLKVNQVMVASAPPGLKKGAKGPSDRAH